MAKQRYGEAALWRSSARVEQRFSAALTTCSRRRLQPLRYLLWFFWAQAQLQVPQGLKVSSVGALIASLKACSTR